MLIASLHAVLLQLLLLLFDLQYACSNLLQEKHLQLRKRNAQQPTAAFDLLRLERRLDDDAMFTDDDPDTLEAIGESAEACRHTCNEELRMGLDMVKAHSAFGSIGVPSVMDALDLQLFCRLDAAHDQCLLGCGYEVQFNMRELVCKRTRTELLSHLPCYARAAPQMRRLCGTARCGPYEELELSLPGVGRRCGTLLCDLHCIGARMREPHARCPEAGAPALHYLREYSRIQVHAWLRDLLKNDAQLETPAFWRAVPYACVRLLCGAASRDNCTLPSL